MYTSPHPIKAIAALVHAPISDSLHQIGRAYLLRAYPLHVTAAAICGVTGPGGNPLKRGGTGSWGNLLVCGGAGSWGTPLDCRDNGSCSALLDSCALSGIILRIATAIQKACSLRLLNTALQKK